MHSCVAIEKLLWNWETFRWERDGPAVAIYFWLAAFWVVPIRFYLFSIGNVMPVQLSRPFYHTDIQEPQQTVKHACFSLSSFDKKKKKKRKEKSIFVLLCQLYHNCLNCNFLKLQKPLRSIWLVTNCFETFWNIPIEIWKTELIQFNDIKYKQKMRL